MNVGFVGLGKLGFPVALAVELKGHKVVGYDVNPAVAEMLANQKMEYREIMAQDAIEKSEMVIGTMADVVSHADIIFIPIQTPHDPMYEGTTRIPESRMDFNYDWLKSGIKSLAQEIESQGNDKIVIIISTVLPGTIEREIKPLLNSHMKLCYNPFFIAMGTTIRDFINPEFTLFGVDDEEAAEKAEEFYQTIHDKPFFKTSIKTAELIKVAYNTYIGMKIAFANTMMEICHKTGAITDDVTDAMGLATERIMSTRYLYGGMGDGGGCHPRDNIAMSWLSNELGLSHNFFDDIMMAREHQTEWLADMMEMENLRSGSMTVLPMVILGKSFKPETSITTGSPSILLKNILKERGVNVVMYDPYVDEGQPPTYAHEKSVFLIGTKHEMFSTMTFPEGSIVIDPHRYIPDQKGIKVIRLGE